MRAIERAPYFASVWLPVLLASAGAAEPGAAQKAVVDAYAAQVINAKVVCDDAGNVTRLAVSNHPAFRKDKSSPPPPGIDDQDFAKILELPRLEAIALERQPLGDASYALLGRLKGLRDVRLHYVGSQTGSGGQATPDFPLFVNELPGLQVLELKHCFSIKGGCMEKLKPQAELLKLEIDTGYAGSSAVPFIVAAKKLRNLQIHRTTMTDADLQAICAALPELEVLLIRPANQRGEKRITGSSLRHLKACSKLRVLVLGLEWGALPYEGGLDALAAMPSLKQVSLAPSDIKDFGMDDPAVRKLREARPDLLIRVGSQTAGGVEGQTWEQEDAEWNWDGGVTTHG